jgi:hypothetical protein
MDGAADRSRESSDDQVRMAQMLAAVTLAHVIFEILGPCEVDRR